MAPNGWISVDLGWIWVGYIQDGLKFGPTEIAPGGLQGGQKSGGSQWHQQNILDVSHQDPLRSSHLEPPPTYGQKCLFYGIFGPFLTPLEVPRGNSGGSKWHQQTILWMYPTQIQPMTPPLFGQCPKEIDFLWEEFPKKTKFAIFQKSEFWVFDPPETCITNFTRFPHIYSTI